MKKLLSILSLLVLPLIFTACGGDDEPNYPDQTLVAGSTYSIPGNNAGWTSDNELIASVNGMVVTAERVGVTYIRNGSKSFKVAVTGKFNLYREPCMQWRANKAIVKSFMAGYTLQSEDDQYLFYNGKLREMLTGYSFKNGGLNLSSVALLASMIDAQDVVDFLAERYVYVTHDASQYYYGFATPDGKNIVLLQLQTLNSQVVYFISYAEVSSSNEAPALLKQMAKKEAAQVDPEFKEMFNSISAKIQDKK